jgi:restriction endonuclease S subunit
MKSNNYNREGFNIIITKYEVALTTEKIFLNNYGISLKPKSDIILHKYLGYYLFYNYKDINLKTIKSLEIEIPSLEIQEEIIKYFDNIHNTISILEKEIFDLRKKDLKI